MAEFKACEFSCEFSIGVVDYFVAIKRRVGGDEAETPAQDVSAPASDSSNDEDSHGAVENTPAPNARPPVTTRIELRTGEKHLVMQSRKSTAAEAEYSREATGMDEADVTLFLVNWFNLIQLQFMLGDPEQAVRPFIIDLLDILAHYLDEDVLTVEFEDTTSEDEA